MLVIVLWFNIFYSEGKQVMFDEKSIRNPWKIWQLVKHHYFKQNHYIFYKCQLSQYTNFTMMKLGESIHLLHPKLNLIHGRNHHKKR